MNLPNKLTLARVIAVPFFIVLFLMGYNCWAAVLFIAAAATDALDGHLARKNGLVTNFGKIMDPLADKILLSTSFISLSIFGLIPGWLTVIVISRDLIILIGIITLTMLSVTYEIKPVFVSKITTALQIGTVFISLSLKIFAYNEISYDLIKILFWLTAFFTVISGLVYILKGIKFLNRTPEK